MQAGINLRAREVGRQLLPTLSDLPPVDNHNNGMHGRRYTPCKLEANLKHTRATLLLDASNDAAGNCHIKFASIAGVTAAGTSPDLCMTFDSEPIHPACVHPWIKSVLRPQTLVLLPPKHPRQYIPQPHHSLLEL
jgi:hypothetical protein